MLGTGLATGNTVWNQVSKNFCLFGFPCWEMSREDGNRKYKKWDLFDIREPYMREIRWMGDCVCMCVYTHVWRVWFYVKQSRSVSVNSWCSAKSERQGWLRDPGTLLRSFISTPKKFHPENQVLELDLGNGAKPQLSQQLRELLKCSIPVSIFVDSCGGCHGSTSVFTTSGKTGHPLIQQCPSFQQATLPSTLLIAPFCPSQPNFHPAHQPALPMCSRAELQSLNGDWCFSIKMYH